MSHEITTPSGNELFGLWLADADWQDDSFPDLEPLIVGIQREAADAERRATVERIRAAYEIEEPYAWEDQSPPNLLGGRVSEHKLLAILDAEMNHGT